MIVPQGHRTECIGYQGGKWKSMRVIEEGVSTSTAAPLEQAGVD